jgi:putative ABC transport system permease protein
MLAHYLSLALRNVLRAPLASAVNVLTLAVGLVGFLTAYAFVTFWNAAERHFPSADRTYVVTTSFAFTDGTFARTNLAQTPERAAEALRTDFPALERVARAMPLGGDTAVSSGDRAALFATVAADPEFFAIFDLPFIAGGADVALGAPRSVVLTRAAAAELFGADDPVGRSVLIANSVEATVTGVIADVPQPSHMGPAPSAPLRFELLVSSDVRDALEAERLGEFLAFQRDNWLGNSASTYVLLPQDGSLSAGALREQLRGFVARHVPPQQLETMTLEFGLLPVRDLLRNGVDVDLFSQDVGVSVSAVLSGLGVLVLAIACLNYANLATARAARRVREVGVRKALGAQPAQVMAQHLLEAAVLTVAALVCAAALLMIAAPVLEELSGASLRATLLAAPEIVPFLGVLVVLVTLAAGAYPAVVLARVGPMHALRASVARLGARRIAAALVGAQFAAASLLLIAVTVTALQNARLVRTGLGAAADPLLLIQNSSQTTKVDSATLRAELARVPGVESVTEMAGLPWQRLVAITWLKRSPEAVVTGRRALVRNVGYDFFAVLDIPLVAGRAFDRERGEGAAPAPGSPPRPAPVVVDRGFLAEFGFGSPEEAVGQLLYYARGSGNTASPPFEIVGVAETRRLTFRGAGATATMYGLGADLDVTIARIAPDRIGPALEGVDAAWQRLSPNVPISRQFFDDAFDRMYETFLRLNQAFTGLSLMAFAIATVGLFAMATLVAGRRRREIGVRKTFGASTARVVVLLLASFSKPVLVANLVAWPIAYFAARRYLAAFIDPIALGVAPFLLSLAVTAAIAWLAVGGQTLLAARLKPADVLRHE